MPLEESLYYYRLSMFGDGRHVKARRFPRAVMLDPRFPFSCSLNKLSQNHYVPLDRTSTTTGSQPRRV